MEIRRHLDNRGLTARLAKASTAGSADRAVQLEVGQVGGPEELAGQELGMVKAEQGVLVGPAID